MKRSTPMNRSPLRATPDTARASVKLYRCRAPGCPAHFVKRQPKQRWCSPECGAVLGGIALAKDAARRVREEKAGDRAKREAMKTLPELKAETQSAFNEYVRLRDRAAGHPCICCGEPLRWDVPGGAVDAGHFRSVGSAPHLRFDERNVHAQRSRPCNKDLGGNPVGYRKGLIERIGLAAVEALEADQTPRKYTRDELRAIRDDYRARVRAMKKEAA